MNISGAVTEEMRAAWAEADRVSREIEARHREVCYGESCMSCGCTNDQACRWHEDSTRWTNRLLARIAAALEAGR